MATMRQELLAIARAAWDVVPTLFDSVVRIVRDPAEYTYLFIHFPSLILAQTFVDAWVQTKHLASKHKRAQAHVL